MDLTTDTDPDVSTEEMRFILDGEGYKESLRDGRRVIDHRGEVVDDVTTHPVLRRSVDDFARLYELQVAESTRDVMTYHDDELDARVSIGWMVPRERADLEAKRRAMRTAALETMGVYGRPPDYGPIVGIGFLSVADRLEERSPGVTEKLERFVADGKRGNWTSSALIGDVQSDRRIPPAEKPGRLRVVEERSDGVLLEGSKAAATVGPQAHVAAIASVLMPNGDPNAALLASVPLDSEGITMVLREPLTGDTAFADHPLDSRGEEPDALILFDRVFVPWERVFSYRDMEVLGLYREVASLAHWHILARLAVRAEIFAGTAQLITEVLGTTRIPQVRDLVTDVVTYAATLQAFLVAAEDQHEIWNGIAVPNDRLITVGRLHSLTHYPRIVQLLRELSGQGLISRYTEAQHARPDLQDTLDSYLVGTGFSADEKNRLFNFAWDLTCSSHAMRLALFENVNALPPALIRNDIYERYQSEGWKSTIADYLSISGEGES